MKKKASEYNIGERFLEAGNHDAGTVVSLMLDPTKATKAYILVRSDEGEFTIYSCLRDAVSEASLSRNIPEAVLRQFLFDVFTGEEIGHTPGVTERVPVTLPKFEVKAKPPKPERNEEGEVVIPPSATYGPAPVPEEAPAKPESELEPEPEPMLETVALLPELNFP